ncbi:MAG: methylmalonyl Co-A mutase-associated GTPase MeaB, partial [Magnetospirillum sp.]|nr:methylmalonyl Co-A mutase-associated GTPase MeaB [Magnetospirillum sp.]
PGGGDELQGRQKGLVALADAIVVNKAAGDLAAAAGRAARDYGNALHLLAAPAGGWRVPVLTCSALERRGIDAVWQAVGDYRTAMDAAGRWTARRAAQAHAWMWNEVSETLLATLKDDPQVALSMPELEARVAAGPQAPGAAARQLVAAFRGRT